MNRVELQVMHAAPGLVDRPFRELRPGGFVEPPLRTAKIALVAFGPATAPPAAFWEDATVERWTLNHGHGLDPRWDRLFELHARAVLARESVDHVRGVDQLTTLQRETTRPIYMKAVEPDIPCAVAFPLEAFIQFFGARCEKLLAQPYIESTVAFMLGYAIMRLVARRGWPTLGPMVQPEETGEEIQLWGIELFEQDEYAQQRANFEFFAGYAMGVGIRMTVPMDSAVFNPRAGIYEYENSAVMDLLEKARQYSDERFGQLKREFEKARADNDAAVARMQTLSGVMQEVEANQKMVHHLLRGGRY